MRDGIATIRNDRLNGPIDRLVVPFETIVGQKVGRDALVSMVDAHVEGGRCRWANWSNGPPFVAAVVLVMPCGEILGGSEPAPSGGLLRFYPHIRIVLEVGVPLAERLTLGITS
jgi:hypothetical protein